MTDNRLKINGALVVNNGKEVAEIIIATMMSTIDAQEDARNRIIIECEIITNGYKNEVWIKSNCDGWAEDIKMLFSYYPDELSFTESEFIGKTEKEALDIFSRKDMLYLRR